MSKSTPFARQLYNIVGSRTLKLDIMHENIREVARLAAQRGQVGTTVAPGHYTNCYDSLKDRLIEDGFDVEYSKANGEFKIGWSFYD